MLDRVIGIRSIRGEVKTRDDKGWNTKRVDTVIRKVKLFYTIGVTDGHVLAESNQDGVMLKY
jgi:hypothetical protein